MGSVNEAKQAGLTDPPKAGHQIVGPETDGPLFTHSICSNTNTEFSDLDPLVPNAVYGTLSTPGPMIEDVQVDVRQEMPSESARAMVLQILVPFLLAGFGTVMAGTLLELVQVSMADDVVWVDCEWVQYQWMFVLLGQHWEVFLNVTEIFILVPPLLGLKGNLEMTLASRLSTAVKIQNTVACFGYIEVILVGCI